MMQANPKTSSTIEPTLPRLDTRPAQALRVADNLEKHSVTTPEKLLRLPAVMAIVGMGKSSVYEGVKNGTFPAPIKLSRRAVCWPESHIAAWVAERIQHAHNFGG